MQSDGEDASVRGTTERADARSLREVKLFSLNVLFGQVKA